MAGEPLDQGTLAEVIDTAREMTDSDHVARIVYRDPEIGVVLAVPEAWLGIVLRWLNLTDILWTSTVGMLSDDLLDAEYKRLAEIRENVPC